MSIPLTPTVLVRIPKAAMLCCRLPGSASLVWWPGCQTASAKRKLRRVQRLACLEITGAMHTTPTNAVEALICLPPLELVVQSEARSAAH